MHSSLTRLQTSSSFMMTVAFAVSGFIAISVLLFPQTPSASVSIRNTEVQKGRPHYYSPKREEYATIKFDLDADFTSLFTWNTKQLFVWVEAEYPGNKPGLPASEAIIWDLIIESDSAKNAPKWGELIAPITPYLPAKVVSTLGLPKPSRRPSSSSSSASKSKSKSKEAAKKPRDWTKPDPDAKPGMLQLRNVKPKYQITDISGSLAERQNVTLKVGWNVQPWVGGLQWSWTTELVAPLEGMSYASQKGLLSGGLWKWRPMNGGVSELFELPALPGKKKESAKVVPPAEETILSHGEIPKAGKAKNVIDV